MVTEEDEEKLIEDLLRVVGHSIDPPSLSLLNHVQGAENLGMAMTFTLVSYLREAIGALIKEKIQIERKREAEKERLALEVSKLYTSHFPFFDIRQIGRRKAHTRDTCDIRVVQSVES